MSFMMSSMNGDGELQRGEPRRYLFELELKAGSRTEYKWTPESALENYNDIPEVDTEGNYNLRHSLVLRRAILGQTAKANESNLVTVEVIDPEVNEKSTFPLVYLTKGKEPQSMIDFSFPELPELSVTFTLEEGSGPVHLVGYHFVERVSNEYTEVDEDVGEEEEESDMMDPENLAEAVEKVKAVIKAKRRNTDEVCAGDVAPKKVKVEIKKNGAGEDEAMEPEPVQATADK